MRNGRNAILKAAVKLFAEKGFAGASTREICQQAGITKPVLYYHFRSKEHLYQELMIDLFSDYRKKLLKVSKVRGTLRERLLWITWSGFRETRNDPVSYMFLFRMIFSPAEQQPYFNYIEEFESERRILAQILQEGIDAGQAYGSAKNLATALMGMQLMATLEYLFTGRPTLTRRSAEKFVDILLGGGGAR